MDQEAFDLGVPTAPGSEYVGKVWSWTQVAGTSRAFSLTVRTGTVTAVKDGIATVRLQNGHTTTVHIGHLRTMDEPSQLDELMHRPRTRKEEP